MSGAFFCDLKYAVRTARRAPGFSAGVVVTLALGIAAATAIFTVVYGVLLRPLPYRDADRLVVIRMERLLEGVQHPVRSYFPLEALQRLRDGTRAFESLAFYAARPEVLTHKGFNESVQIAWVSESFFTTVGGRLQSGRGLMAPSERASAVISARLRQRFFGTDEAVGSAVTVRGRTYQIVGVADRTFQIPGETTDVWLPATEVECCAFAGIARLGTALSASQAAAELNALMPSLTVESPRVYAGASASVVAIRDELTGSVRAALWVLLASVMLLMAVACTNAATLLLARRAARSRETAIRIALGASRWRLSRERLAEATLAAAVAAGIGILLAAALIEALIAIGPSGLPQLHTESVRIDLPVLMLSLAVVGVVSTAIGLMPRAGGADVIGDFRSGAAVSAEPKQRRLQNLLVVTQLAVTVILLVGASLLGRSLVKLMSTDLGVRSDGVATAAINLAYQRRLTDAQQIALVQTIVERLQTLPNVQAAGAGASLPPKASTIRLTLKRFGDAVDYQATAVPATPGYFQALGIRLLQGRFFSDADVAAGRQVMIMTADTARRFFDDENPIGRTMTLPILRDGVPGTAETALVGIVDNVKHSGLDAPADDAVYRPLGQQAWPRLFVVVRTTGDPRTLVSMLRQQIGTVAPAVAVASVATLESIVAGEAAQPRFRTAVLTGFAASTLAIACAGLAAVVAHSVSRRTREFGVRMALGATTEDLFILVFHEGAKLAVAGIVVGVLGSLAVTRALRTLLFGIAPTDGVSYAIAAGLVLLGTAAATWVPARKAVQVQPTAALRLD